MKNVRLSVPGKIMLAGEYSVLRGGHALAATIDRVMTIDVTYDQNATSWLITSDLWQEPVKLCDFKTPQTDPLVRAVQASAKRHNLQGGKVEVSSQLKITDGVGSSSALRLGICSAMQLIKHDRDMSRRQGISTDCVQQAWALQTESQGMASGYDIATQYVGGLVEFCYEYEGNTWKPSWFRHDLDALSQLVHVFVGGEGAPTTSTMQTTSSWLDGGNRMERLVDTSESLVDSFLAAIRFPHMSASKKLFTSVAHHRALFAGNPHFPTELALKLSEVSGLDSQWSWKTTGAGGEDAILLIGTFESTSKAAEVLKLLGWHRLEGRFSEVGIQIDHLGQDEVTPPTSTTRATRSPRSLAAAVDGATSDRGGSSR